MTDKEQIKAIIKQYADKGERIYNESCEYKEDSQTIGYWDGYRDCANLLLRELEDIQEEPKECMYSTANYTNGDRLTLCKDCKELCRYNQKTAAESLGISQEAYDEIVDKCLYGSEVELVNDGDLPKEEPKAKFKVGDNVMYLNEEYVIIDNKKHYTLRSTKERTSVPVVHIDFGNENYELRLVEESKKCMYSKDHYTDEDRKVLCEGCEEECKYAQKEADWLLELHCKLDSLSKEDFDKVWAKYHQKEEPVSEDLEEAIDYYLNNGMALRLDWKQCDITFKASKLIIFASYIAQWQKEQMMKNIWKPADGDALPEYDREVIAILDYDFGHYKVVYAHRPNPNGWNGTNIDTEEKEHFEPEIYDKGGWNQPHVLYWLDGKLPYEENKITK